MDTPTTGLDLAAWRAKQKSGEEFVLPSGLTVTLRRVGVLDLAARGEIPATLTPQLDQMMKEGRVNNITMEDFKRFAEMVNLVAAATLMAPEGLGVEELPYEDRIALFAWANSSGGKLQPFRKQEAESLEPPHVSNSVRTKT